MRCRVLSLFSVCCLLALFTWATFFSVPSVSAEEFDWRNLNGENFVSTVKSQWSGTCWAFAGIGTLEAKYMITRNDPNYVPNLSEQQVIWETNPDMGSSGGGWADAVLNYSTYHGIVTETECPMQNTNVGFEPYWPLADGWENRVVKGASFLDNIGNIGTAAVKNALKQYGPLQVNCQVDNEWWPNPGSYRGLHAVIIVGYHDNVDEENAPGGGYWIIKNSWGTGAGSGGYYKIAYATRPKSAGDLCALNGPAYYTGAMTEATWKGGSGTWSEGSKTMWNDNYYWENIETGATFGGTGGTVTVSGSVIAHGMTVNSTGYSFTGGSLTVTAGGITAAQSTTISSPLYVGGPQIWDVASGKTLTISGALHTVISDVTISGAGNVAISGAIDGGGYANLYAGTKPGGLIKSNSGTLILSGVSDFGGDITVNTGTLSLTGAGSNFGGAVLGSGGINVNSAGTISIGGGTSLPITIAGGTLGFIPASGVTATFSGVISGASRPVVQNGPGTSILSASNTYTGTSTISSGVLQAKSGTGLPSSSLLVLNGGVLQGHGTQNVTFTRTLSSSAGSNRFYWDANGGGFSANNKTMNVRVNNGTSTLTWGTTQGSQIVGALMLSSTTAQNYTRFQNGINLNAGTRTVQVYDNPDSTADYGQISGVISGTGASNLVKTGNGKLYLSATNTYAGSTTISDGALQAAIGTAIPTNSLLKLDGGVYQNNSAYTFSKTLGTSAGNFQWTANGGGFAAGSGALNVRINNGTSTLTWGTTVGSHIVGTLALNSAFATNTTTFQNGINLNGAARTINVDDNTATSADYAVLSGVLSGGAGSSLTKNGLGTLQISGSSGNTYSGSTTVNSGTVKLSKSSGYAIPGDLTINSPVDTGNPPTFVQINGNSQIASASNLTFNTNGSGQWATLELLGHDLTVAGISDSSGRGAIENTEFETGIGNCTLTVNNAADCAYNGFLADSSGGSGTLALVKNGAGYLSLMGDYANLYTGGTTISGGMLEAWNAVPSSNVVNNGTLAFYASTADLTYSGAISGTGEVVHEGFKTITFDGTASNTCTGLTTVTRGVLNLAKTNGALAVSGDILVDAITDHAFIYLGGDNQIASNKVVTFNSEGNYWPEFEVLGYNQTLGGISDSSGMGYICNQDWGTTVGDGTLTINNSADYSYNGYIDDARLDDTTLAFVKGGSGTLTLIGANVGGYTGGLTVNAGTLDLSDGVLPDCTITVNGGTLIYPGGGFAAMASASSEGLLADDLLSIANNGTLQSPDDGSLTLASITGTGTTVVNGCGSLVAKSIVQHTLTIGGASSTAVAVPEPGTLVLLALAGLALAGVYLRRK